MYESFLLPPDRLFSMLSEKLVTFNEVPVSKKSVNTAIR